MMKDIAEHNEAVADETGLINDKYNNNNDNESNNNYDNKSSSPMPLLSVDKTKYNNNSTQYGSQYKLNSFTFAVTISAAISGLLFGYDTGVISGVLVSLRPEDLSCILTSRDKELITSATTFGALIASLLAGSLADYFGRKYVIGIADIAFIGGAIIQATATRLWILIFGRFIVGVGVGLASLVVPLYISELAPACYRGRLIVINVLCITFGQVVAYLFNLAFGNVHHGWRWMVGLGSVPAGIQSCILFFVPESPRFLVRRNKFAEALSVLHRIYPTASAEEHEVELNHFKQHCINNSSKGSRTSDLKASLMILFRKKSNIRALVIACGLQGLQQLCGLNSLMYYSATIFQMVGFNNPIATSLVVACTNFIFTLIAFTLIDRIGRRRILLSTVWGMAAGLLIAAIAFRFLPRDPITSEIIAKSGNPWGIVILISIMFYVAFYATGIGNVPWQQSELFPQQVRGLGTSISTAVNWTSNLLVSLTFLSLIKSKLTATGTFLLYAGVCVIGEIFVYFAYPELAGLVLEEIHDVLEHNFGIKKASQLRALRRNRQTMDNNSGTNNIKTEP